MKLFMFAVAALSAIALGQDTSTTTHTSTTILTKTITLSQAHTVTPVHDTNTTSTSHQLSTGASPTGVGSTAFRPTVVPTTGAPIAIATKGPTNAGSALAAGKVALAGVAGMLIVAVM